MSCRICAWMSIQRRGWLIGYQHRRPTGERHGDHHPLAHAAGEAGADSAGHLFRLGNTHLIEHLFRRAQRLFAPSPWCRRRDSAICSPMVKTGFSEVIGSPEKSWPDRAHAAHLAIRLLIERDHLPVTPPQPQPLAVHLCCWPRLADASAPARSPIFPTDSPTIASVAAAQAERS